MFKIKSHTYQRHSEGANKTSCAPGPRERSRDLNKTLSLNCIWMFACLLWWHVSAVACCKDRGSGYSRPGRHGIEHPQEDQRMGLGGHRTRNSAQTTSTGLSAKIPLPLPCPYSPQSSLSVVVETPRAHQCWPPSHSPPRSFWSSHDSPECRLPHTAHW